MSSESCLEFAVFALNNNSINRRAIGNTERDVSVQNSVYSHVIYDSTTVERPFAVDLNNNPDVKMFFKIPDRFKIETPIGTYNPDWAVYVEKDGIGKLAVMDNYALENRYTIDINGFRRHHEIYISGS